MYFFVGYRLALLLVSLIPLAISQSYAQQVSSGQQEAFKEVRLASEKFVNGAPIPNWVDPAPATPETLKRDPIVLQLSDTQFFAGETRALFVRRIWKINDASAVEELGHLPIGFQSTYQSVKFHSLKVRRGTAVSDQTRSARVRFLQREMGLEQGVYDGEITASILVDDLRVGDSLELAYTVEGSNPIFENRFMEAASWDAYIPIELRRVTLHSPVDRKIGWRVVGDVTGPLSEPVVTFGNGRRMLQWQNSLTPLMGESHVPYGYVAERYIQFSEFKSWSEVVRWGIGLFESQSPPTIELKKVAQLFDGVTQEEKISQALSWVQSEVRYFSVSLGEGSHRPRQPVETLSRRWGDCKDKAFLLVELLKTLGVDAQPVLVSTRNRTGITKLLPTALAFDHVIVRVQLNSREYFLDPTRLGQSGRLDKMGQSHEGLDALVLSAATRDIATIRSPNFEELATVEIAEKIRIDKLGGAGTLEVHQSWSGVRAENIRASIRRTPMAQVERSLMAAYEQRYPGIERLSDTIVHDDPKNNLLAVTSRYGSQKMSLEGSGEWAVRYSATNFQGLLTQAPAAIRALPLAVSSTPQLAKYRIDVEFPPDVSVVSDPYARSVKNPAFEFTVAGSFRGNQASASLVLRVIKTQIDAKEVPEYMDSIRKTGDIHRPAFIVTKSDVKSTGLFGMGSKSLQQSIGLRLAERIDVLTKSIQSGRLKGDDLARAHCERSEAKMDQENGKDALADAQIAVSVAPNYANAYGCRAGAWFLLGDYAKSISDFDKAVTFGNSEMHSFYRRGHAKFYAGQFAGAVDDFARAVSLGDGEGSLYAELWRIWAQARIGQKPGAAQLELAKESPLGDWPRPALALMHDLISVEDMLKQIDNKKGDEREMALAEGYFYVGQYYLAKGDRGRAIEYFKKTREKGVTIYVEHVAAGKELQQLGATP